jgi:hypothetical protein
MRLILLARLTCFCRDQAASPFRALGLEQLTGVSLASVKHRYTRLIQVQYAFATCTPSSHVSQDEPGRAAELRWAAEML